MRLPVLANPANQVALLLTSRDYISYSQVSTFCTCPLRWYFQYVLDMPQEQVGASLVFGGAIHKAIEFHYDALLLGEAPPDIDRLVEVFDQACRREQTAPIRFGKGESWETLREMARRMLGCFVESEQATIAGTVLGIEEEVRTPYIDGVPDLLARIDLLVLKDDALVIRDFKTSRSAWDEQKLWENAPQLLLYGDLIRPIAEGLGALPAKMEFVVLTKTKATNIATVELQPDDHRLAQVRNTFKRVWSAMQAGNIYPNPSPMNCASCAHQMTCRNWCD